MRPNASPRTWLWLVVVGAAAVVVSATRDAARGPPEACPPAGLPPETPPAPAPAPAPALEPEPQRAHSDAVPYPAWRVDPHWPPPTAYA